jgi:hypothetical protein
MLRAFLVPSPWMVVSGLLGSVVLAQFFVWKDEASKRRTTAAALRSALENVQRAQLGGEN